MAAQLTNREGLSRLSKDKFGSSSCEMVKLNILREVRRDAAD